MEVFEFVFVQQIPLLSQGHTGHGAEFSPALEVEPCGLGECQQLYLLCSSGKRVLPNMYLLLSLIHSCKAQRNLNSFFAIVMGLNTASVSRLSQTWEVSLGGPWEGRSGWERTNNTEWECSTKKSLFKVN